MEFYILEVRSVPSTFFNLSIWKHVHTITTNVTTVKISKNTVNTAFASIEHIPILLKPTALDKKANNPKITDPQTIAKCLSL